MKRTLLVLSLVALATSLSLAAEGSKSTSKVAAPAPQADVTAPQTSPDGSATPSEGQCLTPKTPEELAKFAGASIVLNAAVTDYPDCPVIHGCPSGCSSTNNCLDNDTGNNACTDGTHIFQCPPSKTIHSLTCACTAPGRLCGPRGTWTCE